MTRASPMSDGERLMVRAAGEFATAATWGVILYALTLQGAEPAALQAAAGIMDRHQERGERWARTAEGWLHEG